MTAEIAIINRHGVALAADSAFTIGRKRVEVGNKLFSLSPANDIGVMIYGSGDYLGYSWEILIKTFREFLSDKTFSTVSQCADAFLKYLEDNKFSNHELEELSAFSVLVDALEMVKAALPQDVACQDFSSQLQESLDGLAENIEERHEKIPGAHTKKKFIDLYAGKIGEFSEEIFARKIDAKTHVILVDFLHSVFSRKVESNYSTGIVFSGYGSDQFFPELVAFKIDGKSQKFRRVWRSHETNLNEGKSRAVVVPFAQSDMFQVFMEGVSHDHYEYILEAFTGVLDDKSTTLVSDYVSDPDEQLVELARQKKDNEEILKQFLHQFSSYIRKTMISPVLNVIGSLPKEEMAAMAEALVEITTLRRKVDSSLESVGGPTDVAVISKGDGLVWIKRKHYFDIEMNQDFLRRKSVKHGGGNADE